MQSEKRQNELNFALPPAEYVGKADKLQSVVERLDDIGSFLVITGPPGVGKTRFAKELARKRHRDLESGAWLCDLGQATTRQEALEQLGRCLRVSSAQSESSLSERIDHKLQQLDNALVILDSIENLNDSALELVETLAETHSGISWIATSRDKSILENSEVLEIAPLDPGEAVDLFEIEGQTVRPGFSMDTKDRETVKKLVTHLDCLPLAIKLISSKLQLLSPSQIYERFIEQADSNNATASGVGDALIQAIEWSWRRLDSREKKALEKITLFEGGFTLEAFEAVGGSEIDRSADIVQGLLSKSLLYRTFREPEHVRLHSLEIVDQFISSEIGAFDEDSEFKIQFARYYAEKLAEWIHKSRQQAHDTWASCLIAEAANARKAFDISLQVDESLAYRLAVILDYIYELEGNHEAREDLYARLEGRSWEPRERLHLMFRKARHLGHVGKLEEGAALLEEGLRNLDESNDSVWASEAFVWLGDFKRRLGDFAGAIEALQNGLDRAKPREHQSVVRLALAILSTCKARYSHCRAEQARRLIRRFQSEDPGERTDLESRASKELASACQIMGALDLQKRSAERAFSLARSLQHTPLVALCLQTLGDGAAARGALEEATDYYERAVRKHRECGQIHYQAVLLGNLATIYHRRDDYEQARQSYQDALELHRRTNARPYEISVLSLLGSLYHERREYESASRYYEQGYELSRAIDQPDESGGFCLKLAWLKLETRQFQKALDYLDLAQRHFDDAGSTDWQLLTRLSRVIVDLAQDREQKAGRRLRAIEGIAERMNTSTPLKMTRASISHLLDGQPVDDPSGDFPAGSFFGRLLQNLFERLELAGRLADEGQNQETADLAIEESGRWVYDWQTEGLYDLEGRKQLRLILQALVDEYRSDDADELDVYQLFEIGWPGQQADRSSVKDRVYWAIRELRKQGLEDILLTGDDGYHLSETAEILIAERGTDAEAIQA